MDAYDCEYQGTKYYADRVKIMFVPAMPNCEPRSQNYGVLCDSNVSTLYIFDFSPI